MEEKKRKPINPDLIILAWLAVIVLVFSLFFHTCSHFSTDNGIISFSMFGKLELRGVDKMAISVGEEQFVVTDRELLDQVIGETAVATHGDLRCPGTIDRRIDLYRGEKLVRSMEWSTCTDAVFVFEEDLTHWVFPGEFGCAVLSKDLVSNLNALVAANIPQT